MHNHFNKFDPGTEDDNCDGFYTMDLCEYCPEDHEVTMECYILDHDHKRTGDYDTVKLCTDCATGLEKIQRNET
jgi:hypothetical protein